MNEKMVLSVMFFPDSSASSSVCGKSVFAVSGRKSTKNAATRQMPPKMSRGNAAYCNKLTVILLKETKVLIAFVWELKLSRLLDVQEKPGMELPV